MRVFAALELPEESLRMIAEWQSPLISRYPSLKWVSVDNMHITLRFYGDIGKDILERVRGTMAEWRPGPLGFTLSGVGSFGRKGSPSVYWLGGEFPVEVMEQARRLGAIPDGKGAVLGRRFLPHLTVARRRGGLPVSLPGPVEGIGGVITRAALVDSRLTSEGPEYTFLERYEL
ncbi:MAG: RNA 2',3'-cyclic phosphodiesterase [Candidatus Aegiribacteria sp.]